MKEIMYRLLRLDSSIKDTPWKQDILVFLGFFVFFVIFFVRIWHGEGQYWDNSFPFFSDQLVNYFNLHSYTWSAMDNLGTTLSYNSDYFFRYVISRFSFFEPEHVLYFFHVITFTLCSFITYLIFPKDKKIVAIFTGLLSVVNPAIFYNYFAGFYDYLVSYAFFILLVFFLVKKFKGTYKDYIILGLIIGLGGAELQFFVFDAVVLFIFLIVNRNFIQFKGICSTLGIIIFLNFVWITNFLVGVTSLNDTSSYAAKNAFLASQYSNFLNVFDLTFAQATQIHRTYPIYITIALFFIVILAYVFIYNEIFLKKKIDKRLTFYLVSLVVFLFFGTGYFNAFQVWPLDTVYVIFRESDHFAAPMFFFLILILGYLLSSSSRIFLQAACLIAICFIALNTYTFQTNMHAIDFRVARTELAPYKAFIDQNPNEAYLMYPFWEQYDFIAMPIQSSQDNYPLSNNGWDSFLSYADVPFINNNIKPFQVASSTQLQLLTNFNTEPLRTMGVSYILNLSSIFNSYWNIYVASSAYNEDLSLVKDNPNFTQNILSVNGNAVTLLDNNIIKINNVPPLLNGAQVITILGGRFIEPVTVLTFGQIIYCFFSIH
jgi:hypothetical protein